VLSLSEKQKLITDEMVFIFEAYFARIWQIREGDLCEKGCIHAQFEEGPGACSNRVSCLHLVASSGRDSHIDGKYRRVPFGCYKIGRLVSGEVSRFVTNDVTHDPDIEDHEWAQSFGLVSFAGFRLASEKGEPLGVLALFSKQAITSVEVALLSELANYLSMAIQADKARDMILESEEKFRTVANFTYAMETWRTPEGRYRYVSPSSERITGHTAEEFLADPNLWLQIIHPDDQSKVIEHFLAGNRPAEAHNMGIDFRILTPDGESRCLGHSCTAVYGRDGQFLGRRGSFREITKLKRAEVEKEEAEVQKRRLQKAESLGRMAAAIAHHFNNKLQVVMGYLELSLESLSKDDKIINDLTTAKQAVDEAAEMSRLMLIYLGQVIGPRVLLNLSEICEECLSRIQSTMPKNVILQTDLPSPGPTIVANSKQIQLIITSLIANAWEAVGGNRGTILLSVKMVSSADIPHLHRFPVNWQPETTSYACLEIRDTGCGIMAKDIEKSFDPFFSTKFIGRGLGLPVVFGLVQAHRGVITVESVAGQGSVFRVFFPLSAAEVHLEPDKAARAPEMQWSGTVLLVDDDKNILDLSRAMLTMLGFEVLSAGDGIEAVEVFRQHKNKIRFVLTDSDMPHMNGLETLTALRRIAPGIPVILTSGYSKDQVMDSSHPECFQVFLGKPYSIQALKDAIRSTLEDKQG
jgi:PAS domain S-box-containing protein